MVTIRPATETDAETLLHIHVGAIIADAPAAYSDRQVSAWAAKTEGTQRYIDSVRDESTEIVVAETNSVVGFGELDLNRGEIETVFVDPHHQGGGVGSAVLEYFETRLGAAGHSRARLRAAHNAVGFYEEHGYQQTGTDTRATTNDVELTSVWMEKQI